MAQDHPTDKDAAARPARSATIDPATRSPRMIALGRRRWVFRSTVTLAMTAVVLCFFVAWRRDQNVIHNRIDALKAVVTELQSQVDSLGRLPADPPESSRLAFSYYVSDVERYYAPHAAEPMIIAATDPITMLFKSDGLAVIVYDKGKVSAAWMLNSEYENAREKQRERIDSFDKERMERPIVLP